MSKGRLITSMLAFTLVAGSLLGQEKKAKEITLKYPASFKAWVPNLTKTLDCDETRVDLEWKPGEKFVGCDFFEAVDGQEFCDSTDWIPKDKAGRDKLFASFSAAVSAIQSDSARQDLQSILSAMPPQGGKAEKTYYDNLKAAATPLIGSTMSESQLESFSRVLQALAKRNPGRPLGSILEGSDIEEQLRNAYQGRMEADFGSAFTVALRHTADKHNSCRALGAAFELNSLRTPRSSVIQIYGPDYGKDREPCMIAIAGGLCAQADQAMQPEP